MCLTESGAERNDGEVVVRRETAWSLEGSRVGEAKSVASGEANLRNAKVKRVVRAARATTHGGDSRHYCFEICGSEY